MKIIDFINDKRLIFSFIIILLSLLIYNIIKKIVNIRINNLVDSNNLNKKKTYLKLIKNVMKYLLIILNIILILQVYGINVSSIIAGLGIVSLITGLALQDAFKDIIAGFNIIIDNYFSVGDVIKLDGIEGKVLEIKLKVTKIKDIDNQNIYVVANRNIIKSLNISNIFDIDIPIPYEEKISKVEEIIDEMCNEISKVKDVKDIKYMGINEYGDSAIFYKIRIWCIPEFKNQIRRESLRLIKSSLDKNKISIPYTQIDIHSK